MTSKRISSALDQAKSKIVLMFDKDAYWLCEQLAAECPDFAFIAATTIEEALSLAGDAQILCALAPRITPALIDAMPRLEWVQALTTGTDNLLAMPGLSADIAISACQGIHGPQMSELAILLMLSAVRQFPKMLANQKVHFWERWPQPLLWGKTACIVGLGAISESLADRCRAFGMRLTGVSDSRSNVAGFARIYPRTAIAEAASDADFLVVIVPYAPETHHLIDADVLAAMRPTGILVNISRGGCVDEAALLACLRAGSIAGAALDVFAIEPLAQENPFWGLPNLIVTPHIGGMSDIYAAQILPLIAENMNAYATSGARALTHRVRRDTAEGLK